MTTLTVNIDNEKDLPVLQEILTRFGMNYRVDKDALAAADKSSFKKFSGIWSTEEAKQIEQTIAESCEQIDANDWK